jgi:hypothetical protein
MPDAIQPVGAMVKGPDLGTLSSILGIQQQRQALQTGAYQQQAVQADSAQAQQKNAELQAVGNLVKTATTSGRYLKPDGSFDDGKFSSDVAQVAPVYGQGIRTQALSAANEILANRQGLQALNEKQQTQLGGLLTSLAQKPDLNNSDIIDAIESARQLNPSPEFSRMLTSVATHLQPDAGPDALRATVQQIQSQVTGQPLATPSTITGTQGIVPGTTQRFTGQFTPASGAIPGTAPGAIAGATTAGAGSANVDVQRQADVSNGVQAASAGIPLTQQADRLVDMISSGKAAQWLAEKKIAVGSNSPEAVARVELGKILSAIQNNGAASAGAKSVEALQQQAAANPHADYPTDAVHAAMDVARGSMRQAVERNANLTSYLAKHGNVGGFATADATLTGAHNPLVVEYNAISDPAAKAAFLKRQFPNDRNAAKSFIETVRGSYHAVPGGQ